MGSLPARWDYTNPSGSGYLAMIRNDLRYAFRQLSKRPGFTFAVVVTLGMGIGASTALFSVIEAVLLRTLPVRDPQDLLLATRFFEGRKNYDFPYPAYMELQQLTDVFAGVSASWIIDRPVTIDLANGNARVHQARIGLVSGNYFTNVGARVIRGRGFTADDDGPAGARAVVVISHALWTSQFGGTDDAIGRVLRVNGLPYAILGVTAREFTGDWIGRPVDLWVPYAMASQVMPEVPGGRELFPALILARLRDGTTHAQAQSVSNARYSRYQEQSASSAHQTLLFESGARGYAPQRAGITQPLAILGVLIVIVLGITSANVANLLLTRAMERQRETAVRLALGAARSGVVQQYLVEGTLLTSIGTALGVLLSVWLTTALTTMLASGPAGARADVAMPGLSSLVLELRPNGTVFAFTLVVTVGTSLVLGVAPALRSVRASLTPWLTLRRHGAGPARGSVALFKGLVVTQVALSAVLLVGAGLLAKTLRNLSSQHLGFDRRSVLLVWTAPSQSGRTGQALIDFWVSTRVRLSMLPGVLSVSVANGGVLDGSERGGRSDEIVVEGRPSCPGLVLREFVVAPTFFHTIGIPFVAGRDFTEQDSEAASKVTIISETMARFLFGTESPIGKHLGSGTEAAEIVGVVRDAKHGTPRDERGISYVPYQQAARFLRVPWCIVIRTDGDVTRLVAPIRQVLAEVDPMVPLFRVNTVDEQLAGTLVQERLLARLSVVLGAVAVLLASVGLYGIVSYMVRLTATEIGIRLALGATPVTIVRLTLQTSLLVVGTGLVIGVPLAVAASTLIAARLFGVVPGDPLTVAGAILILTAVGTAASLIPARRAARLDPMTALTDSG